MTENPTFATEEAPSISSSTSFHDVSTPTTSFSSNKASEEKSEVKNETDVYDNIDVQSFSEAGFKKIPAAYAGMPREVLLHYSRQTKFAVARKVLAGLVILTILALLSMVIALIAVSPACQQFWQTSPIYQIYPKSFYDTNNDGFGDLKGITAKLGYLKDLGVSSIWLNPIYKSPQKDNGYDVEDYRAIDETFGTMDDFDELITELHNEGMKLIMDFVPNHTSNESEWFIASSDTNHANHEVYKDYYVWVDGKGTHGNEIPNNWQSVFSQYEPSAWQWHEGRQQFYYHAFFKEQPDLNFRNPAVLDELKGVLSYWFDKGVDGFRIDAIKFMYEAEHLRDNPVKNPNMNLSYENVWGDYTENFFGIHDVIADWRTLFKKYSSEPGIYRFMETEVYDDSIHNILRYYGTPLVKEADFPMNFRLIDLEKPESWNASSIEATVMEWMVNMPEGKWPNWVIGNHDNPRVVSRLGPGKARLAAVLTMTLSGTPGMYYGEEIGMTDTNITNQTDFRDPERTPMQWDATKNGGFCLNCTPWLPVNENINDLNVQAQSDPNDETTMLCLYKRLIAMRSDLVFARGSLCVLNSMDNVFMFVREVPGSRWSTLVAMNFGSSSATIDLKTAYSENLPEEGTVVLKSNTCTTYDIAVNFNSLQLETEESIVVNFKPPKSSSLFTKTTTTSDRCFTATKVCVNVLGLLEVC